VRGLVSGVASPHGWGVERRADFARTLEERTLRGPAALEAWALARATIRDPARSPAYAGLDLAPQLGLLPIGADPDSGLYEFADLATGEPPRRAPSGRLELGGSASVVFVLLPGGPATLGAQSYDPQGLNYDPAAQADESPVHTVELAPFFLSKYELTQGQWRRFTGANPSKHLSGTAVAGRELDDLSPVEQVSWLEASRVLARLGWQLPTEAQWEYAARAGGDLPWWTGAEPDGLEGAANLSDRFARRQGASWRVFEDALDDGYLVQAPVGSFRANPFGLHDVIGNVYEWCSDHPEGYDSVSGSAAEHAASSVPTRAVRGGSYVSAANGARASKRDSGQPELENESIGLRPARALAP
jgi:formylglycine-generating enzyme required for sulfatase activity